MLKLEIRLIEPGGTDSDGNVFVDPEDLLWKVFPNSSIVGSWVDCSTCGARRDLLGEGEQSTICPNCIETWLWDWDIQIDQKLLTLDDFTLYGWLIGVYIDTYEEV